MVSFIIGLVEVTALITVLVACYLALDLVRELRDMRDYAREQADADRYRRGDWP